MADKESTPGTHRFRPLLPSTATLGRQLPPAITQQTATNPLPKRRVLVQTACNSCRQSKAKCSGEKPSCRRCEKQHIECHYPADTSSKALKRDYGNLKELATAQEKILEWLVTLPDSDAQQILRMIRSGMPIQNIYNQVMAGDALMQLAVAPETHLRYNLPYKAEIPAAYVRDNPYLDTLIHESATLYATESPSSDFSHTSRDPSNSKRNSIYLIPFHGATVIDPLLSDVKPSEWTNVCKDDKLMRDMLGVWLQCEYSFTSIIQKDYFLEDMASGNEDFCSSLLVNVVLAYCCTGYIKMSDRSQYWNPATLIYRFLAEARRLWELEAVTPRITTIQAGIIFNVFQGLCGLDEIGQAYRVQAVSLAHQLHLFNGPMTGETQRIRDGKLFLAWALYVWEALVAFSFQIPPLLTKPPTEPLPDPSLQSRWYGEIWLKYPGDQHLSSSHFSHFFVAKSKLRMIMQEFCTLAYTNGVKVTAEDAHRLYRQLKAWEESLPLLLQAKNIALPTQMQLHVYLQHLTLAMFEPLLNEELDDQAGHQPDPKTVVAEATRNLQTLVRLYQIRHNFEAMDLFLIVPLTYLGFKSLEAIGDPSSQRDLDGLRSTLILAVHGLNLQRRNYYLAEGVSQVFRGKMRPEEVALTKETLMLNDGIDDKETNLLKQAIRSYWPVSIVKRKEDLNAHMLANLVSALEIKEKPQVGERE